MGRIKVGGSVGSRWVGGQVQEGDRYRQDQEGWVGRIVQYMGRIKRVESYDQEGDRLYVGSKRVGGKDCRVDGQDQEGWKVRTKKGVSIGRIKKGVGRHRKRIKKNRRVDVECWKGKIKMDGQEGIGSRRLSGEKSEVFGRIMKG